MIFNRPFEHSCQARPGTSFFPATRVACSKGVAARRDTRSPHHPHPHHHPPPHRMSFAFCPPRNRTNLPRPWHDLPCLAVPCRAGRFLLLFMFSADSHKHHASLTMPRKKRRLAVPARFQHSPPPPAKPPPAPDAGAAAPLKQGADVASASASAPGPTSTQSTLPALPKKVRSAFSGLFSLGVHRNFTFPAGPCHCDATSRAR